MGCWARSSYYPSSDFSCHQKAFYQSEWLFFYFQKESAEHHVSWEQIDVVALLEFLESKHMYLFYSLFLVTARLFTCSLYFITFAIKWTCSRPSKATFSLSILISGIFPRQGLMGLLGKY